MELQIIQKKIFELRGQRVMLDFDLAELYETQTKVLKQTVKRNMERFPADFMFELTKDEFNSLRSQIVTSNVNSLRTHFVTSKRGGSRYLPFAFSEQGVAMLSGILNSHKAIQVNISIMRAFVLMRQYSLGYKDLADKITKLERKHNRQFRDVYEALDLLLNEREDNKKELENWKNRKQIGYKH